MKKGKEKRLKAYTRKDWRRDIWLKGEPKEEDSLNVTRGRMFSDDVTVEIIIRETGQW